ncbi:MAG: O-methyltransferase, partial [Gemmatimonadales bacterium]
HDAGLARAFDAPARHGLPPIQVGMSEGKLLTLLLRMAAAKRVVEFGTLAGYSALRMARALPEDGHLWSLELDPRHAEVARENLRAAGFGQRVTVITGPALDALQGLAAQGPFDAVFLDADKGRYDLYGAWAAAHLRPCGLLLVDNAYYFGDLLGDAPDAAAVRRCHEAAAGDFDTVCIPTPDGLLLGIRR